MRRYTGSAGDVRYYLDDISSSSEDEDFFVDDVAIRTADSDDSFPSSEDEPPEPSLPRWRRQQTGGDAQSPSSGAGPARKKKNRPAGKVVLTPEQRPISDK